MTRRLDPQRLAAIGHLERGQHRGPGEGACLMEAASYLAGEAWSDAPDCASEVVAGLLRALNDMLPDRPRQELRRYLPRIVASRGTDAQETARADIAAWWLSAGPGALLRGTGRHLVETAIAAARWHAPDGHPAPGPEPRPRRVPRHVLDAIHDLIDRLLTVTETTPTPPPPAAPAPAPAERRPQSTPARPERTARPRRRPSPLRAIANPRPDPTHSSTSTEQPTE